MEPNLDVFTTFPVLKTERLTLREIREEDARVILSMRSSSRVNQFISRPAMEKLEDAQALVQRVQTAFSNQQGIAWAGILRDGNEIIGCCGFNAFDFANLHAEIGGELSVEYWGKNIPLEAVTAILQFGLYTLGLHTIEAKVNPENRGALYLLELLGFEKEAHFKDRIYFNGKFSDMTVYTLIKGNEKFNQTWK